MQLFKIQYNNNVMQIMKILLIILTVFLLGSTPGNSNKISVGQVLTTKQINIFKIKKCDFAMFPKKGNKLYQVYLSEKDALIIETEKESNKIVEIILYKNVDQAKAFRTSIIVNSYTFKKK